MSLIVFTDLDGTLIDFETYSTEVSKPTVKRLMEARVPLVFCSSKTFDEQRALQEKYGLEMPCIVENGSAIIAPSSFWAAAPEGATEHDGWTWLTLGLKASEVRRRVRRVESEVGESLYGFSSMGTEDVARVTNLDLISARRAQSRDFSETLAAKKSPEFWDQIAPVFAKHGLKCLCGGRFHTVIKDDCNKGRAVNEFTKAYESLSIENLVTVGLGDSPNDYDMLAAVDYPYQVKKPDNTWETIEVADLIHIDGIGPVGWNLAISQIIDELVKEAG
ncbi:HAD-IIB family hydrolase [Puniceicoccaceae bacterium K14]|nr:HAD-IIB family hydrolase [Puniceicoccaceae bacterium K14]